MHLLSPAVALALSFSLSYAQSLIPTNLPACAQQCTILQQAQTGCIPPAAPVTNEGIYTSCFCLSAFLTPLHSGPASNICPACSPGDMGTIQSWYQGFCAAPNQGGGGLPPLTVTTTSSSTSSQTTAPTATQKANSAGGSTISDRPPPNNKAWMSTHWRWILMLIILFFGFGLLAYGAWYLKRRYHRRREAEISRSQPDLGSWGPGRSVHDFGTTGEAPRPPFNEKGKEPERVDIPMQTQALETTKGSKRLKKSWLPGRH